MINPTRGPVPSPSLPRRPWTMISGCAARMPRFSVASNSVDRLMRLRAGSTAGKPAVAFRQITRDGLYGACWTRWSAPPEYASASGSRARGLGAGYSAGRSACPWPRHSPRCPWLNPSSHPPTTLADCVRLRVDRRWVLLLAGAVPGHRIRVAAVSPTFGRLFEGTDQPSLGQTWSAPTDPTEINAKPSSPAAPLRHDIGNRPRTTLKKPIGMQQNCWQPHGKLLASGNAVSEWSGARRRNEDAGSTSGLGGLHDLSPARRSGTVAGRLPDRLPTSCPHLCITMWTSVLSSSVLAPRPGIRENQGDYVVDR
jgi:hypothetical protein